ncbi:MAG: tetratricopeptide repeat protein, partial [Bacteroidota bacterium]
DFDAAIRNLRISENYPDFEDDIPYFLTQIFFAQRRYDELIAYAEPKLNQRGIKNRTGMYQLVGQSYFEKSDYQRALPYLEYYSSRTKKLRVEEFYQLGFAQYQQGKYEAAIKSFQELSDENSLLGQNSMFYLADAYLKLGQKRNALTPLATAKKMDFDPQIQEEALFNHAKLAYELNQPKVAISDLQQIQPQSRFYTEAQQLMSQIFLNYRDYQQALTILDNIPDKTPQLLETYQKVSLYRALQLLQEDKPNEAKPFLQKSLQFPYDANSKAVAIYWLGDIAHQEQEFLASSQLMNQFLTLAQTLRDLPVESSIFTANYIQGYNYLKQENFQAAQQYFQFVVDGIARNQMFIENQEVATQILGDATMRTGDCYFKRRQYTQAIQYYDQAIQNQYAGYDYAIYQKAVIEGLTGNITEKLLALERLGNEERFAKSEFADDALLQLGSTYLEIGKLGQASAPLQKLVSRYRQSSDLINQGLLKLGLISYNSGNLNGAINYNKQVLENNPNSSETTLALSALREIYIDDLGRPNDYYAYLQTRGIQVDNFERDSVNYQTAMNRFQSGEYIRAIDAFRGYIQNFPQGLYLLDAYYNLAESYSFSRQFTNAFANYEYVIGQGPSRYYIEALEKAAIIAYNDQQDFQKSFDYYTRLEAATTDPVKVFDAEIGALRSAYRIGNTQAVYNLSSKVANNPAASNDQRASANFYLGKMAFDQNDFETAFRAFSQVTTLTNNELAAESRYLIAEIYYSRGQLEQAKEITLNANAESSAYPYWVAKSVLLLGSILYDQNDLYNSRAALEALLENYSEDQEIVNQARVKLNQVNLKIEQNSRLNRDAGNRLEFNNNNNGNQ